MTAHRLFDPTTSAALERLDPARRSAAGYAAALTASERGRADTTLERIVSSDPTTAPADPGGSVAGQQASPGVTRRHRGFRRSWPVWLVAVTTVAVLAVPGLIPGRDVAYASWTPTPVRLAAAEAATAVETCLTVQQVSGGAGASTLIAERRGGWTYVLIALTGDDEVSCIMPAAAVTGGEALRNGDYFGGTGNHPPVDAGARHLRQMVAGTGSTDEGLLSYIEGVAGRDVKAVTVTTPRGVTVEASIDNGRYAAWWPAGKNSLSNPEISNAATYTVTLRDGTTSHEPPR